MLDKAIDLRRCEDKSTHEPNMASSTRLRRLIVKITLRPKLEDDRLAAVVNTTIRVADAAFILPTLDLRAPGAIVFETALQ